MALQGQVLINPVSGDIYEFVDVAKSTGGNRVVIRATVHTKGQLVPNHLHVFQDETFEIISGELTVWLNGELRKLGIGESLLLPKNVPHNHYNDSTEPVVYLHTVSPALDFEHLIENLVGLASDGKSKNGKYGLMQELMALRYLDSKAYLADKPIGIQKFLAGVLAPVGRLFGYRAVYKKYSGFDK